MIFSLAAVTFAADLPSVNGAIDAAKNFGQQVQQKVDTSGVVREVNQALPTKEQAAGFLAGVWKIIWVIMKFIAGIFDWILKLIIGLVAPILQKVGLGFLAN